MRLTKKDVVVLALADLGGATTPIDTEDVAIAAHALAPGAFGWRKHPEHIDLDAVRTSLRHEKESADARIAGSIRAGWHLTRAGQRWARDNRPAVAGAVEVADTPERTATRRAETRQVAGAKDRLRSSDAFAAWRAGQTVAPRTAAAVFRIDHYTPERDRHLKTARMAELVADDTQLAEFVAHITDLAIHLQAPTPQRKAAGTGPP